MFVQVCTLQMMLKDVLHTKQRMTITITKEYKEPHSKGTMETLNNENIYAKMDQLVTLQQ